ncbi:hypothetical protein [Pseudorhodoplanes sp.]|uniref:hypothetical protein n=1 Tax=Pseudorhodoplanes sp. TaxID=1934341 RepID=UPI00391D7F52
MKLRTAVVAAALTGLAVVAALVAVPLGLAPAMSGRASAVPSDAMMLAHWEKHRSTLDEITEMLRRDPALNRLGLTWSDPADPERALVPAARIADYRDLMREAGIISVSRGHRSVQFRFYDSGTPVNGIGKSFVRGEPSRYAEIVDGDLDRAASGRTKVLLQRSIADGWWLQRDSN